MKRRLLIAAAVSALALTCATGASAAFRLIADYPGGPVLVGAPWKVRAAVRACESGHGCYRAVTPRPDFRADCKAQGVTPRMMATRLQAHLRGAVYVSVEGRWRCRPFFPEQVVF